MVEYLSDARITEYRTIMAKKLFASNAEDIRNNVMPHCFSFKVTEYESGEVTRVGLSRDIGLELSPSYEMKIERVEYLHHTDGSFLGITTFFTFRVTKAMRARVLFDIEAHKKSLDKCYYND